MRSLIAVSVFLVPLRCLFAHEPVIVSSVDPTHSIQIELICTLGDERGDGIVGPTYFVEQTDNYYFVASPSLPSCEVLIFNKKGEYTHTIGARGSGPGEFRFIRALRSTEDGLLYVFDQQNRRFTVFSTSHDPISTIRLSVNLKEKGVILLDDGSMVINAAIFTPSRIGFPLHMVNSGGSLGPPFGAINPRVVEAGREDSLWGIRWMCLGNSNEVWTTRYTNYEVECWSLDSLERTHHMVREADWFPVGIWDTDSELEPQPHMVDIRQNPDGLVLLLALIPDDEWRNNEEGFPEKDFDFRLEVYNPNEERIIAANTFDDHACCFLNSNHLVTCHTENGVPRLYVWEISILPE